MIFIFGVEYLRYAFRQVVAAISFSPGIVAAARASAQRSPFARAGRCQARLFQDFSTTKAMPEEIFTNATIYFLRRRLVAVFATTPQFPRQLSSRPARRSRRAMPPMT